jgi:hypothetical protein
LPCSIGIRVVRLHQLRVSSSVDQMMLHAGRLGRFGDVLGLAISFSPEKRSCSW